MSQTLESEIAPYRNRIPPSSFCAEQLRSTVALERKKGGSHEGIGRLLFNVWTRL